MIRDAAPGDINAIADILNSEIEGTTASWKARAWTEADTRHWFEARCGQGFPVIVSLGDDGVAGYGSYGPFRFGEGYARTVEHSVYVRSTHRRAGHGGALLEALIARARDTGLRRMIGGISADQTASLAFHERHGFEEVGRLEGVGEKFGRPLDLVLVMLRL